MVLKDEDVIFAYSRKDAIQDGVLIDVATMAKAAGFRIHVAVTSTVFERYVSEPDKLTGIDYDGRLWDVLQALRYAIKTEDKRQSQILFSTRPMNAILDRFVSLALFPKCEGAGTWRTASGVNRRSGIGGVRWLGGQRAGWVSERTASRSG